MMKQRRAARESALQALFFMDMRRNISLEALASFQECFQAERSEAMDIDFFGVLSRGVMKNRAQIDGIIERFSDNWKISRMACVDRNIMRIAVYEMMFLDDIPYKVSINEAIDIGKKFGTEESGAFINGILDSVHNALKRKEITPRVEGVADIPDQAPDISTISGPFEIEDDEKIEKIPFSPVRGKPGVVKRRAPKRSVEPPETDENFPSDS